jgi:peptide/nickel transport system substrate-binding protein
MKQVRANNFKWAVFLAVICLTLGLATMSFAKMVDRFWFTTDGLQRGGTYVTSETTVPNNMDPHIGTTGWTSGIDNITMNQLIRFTPLMDGYELDLAESYEILDALTYKFTIHKGVKFANVPPVNGRELTSTDVKYSIERFAGRQIPVWSKADKKKKGRKLGYRDFRQAFMMGELDKITTPDRYTVIIKTKVPFAPMMNFLASNFNKVVPKEVIDEYGHMKMKAIGSGPFIISDFRRDAYIEYTKNPDYFKKGVDGKPMPYIDGFKTLFIKDNNASLAAFMAHKLDTHSVEHYQRETVMKQVPEAWYYEAVSQFPCVFRMPPWGGAAGPQRKPFDDLRVRQAIVHAIDKDKVIELGRGGYGQKAVGPVFGMPGFSLPESENTVFDPEKSRKLLAEAGYPNGFKSSILTWQGPNMPKYAQIIQAMLKEVGIETELEILELGKYFEKVYRFKYDMAVHVMAAGADPDHMLTPYYGDPKHSTYYKWNDPEIHAMIKKQRGMMDQRKRAKFVQDIQRKLMAQAINVHLFSNRWITAMGPFFNEKRYFHGYANAMVEETWLDLAAQKKWIKR